ncbi:MAG TPA: hypothetical protein VGR28_11640, partial [Candidatus Thermoplasmatota archaeon]|nr:hypothetical protein [Candidatus Thermoplasmatota archaeon]
PDGTVYVPYGANCHDTYVARSRDNGQSWDAMRLHTGGLGGTEDDNDIGVTSDGVAYYVFSSGADHRTWLLRTRDGFDNVEGPFLVSAPDLVSTRFGVLAAGSDGRIAIAYLGTRDSAAAPNDVTDDARWHLFVTFSLDAEAAEPTFVTTQVTPADDPVQIGYMWESGGGDPARNLLDFIDIALDPQGGVHVAFADGCTEDCAGNATATKQQSRARDAAYAGMVAGPSLLVPSAVTAPAAAWSGILPRLTSSAGT